MLRFDLDDNILDEIEEISSRDIAIIGIDVNLPKAGSLDKFWINLKNGKNCVDDMSRSRQKDVMDYLRLRGEDDGNVRFAKGGYLDEIDKFDYEFFKISYNEAKLMDPNQRLFLENVWKAIEDAGYGGEKLVGSNTGVYVGFTPGGEYYQYIKDVDKKMIPYAETGNLSSVVASRISYILNLKGPSMIVNTECSSSLVALHLACRSLRNNEIDAALVGGVRVAFCPVYSEEKLGIESDKEMICTFDDDSDGAVFGEGSIALVIKRYDKAIKDRDSIYAVIKGSCINQDGSSVGITAPNVGAQEEVICGAWKDAGVSPDTISYIETHGTGTRLGDPIEVQAINNAFKRYTGRKQFCGVGSVKTNISHLDNVSGMVSLVKTVLALKNKQIPPSINFNCPNRRIDFETSPVYVNNRLSNWATKDTPRRCGISSFGLSGTNSHVILEENENDIKIHNTDSNEIPKIFTISAIKKEGLTALISDMKKYLTANREIDISDICYTMNTGRGHYNYRLAVIVYSLDELCEALDYICVNGIDGELPRNIVYKKHIVVSDKKKKRDTDEITESIKKNYNKESEQLVTEYLANDTKKDILEKLSLLYVKGSDIEWEKLYEKEELWRVNLPTYVFEKKRCWLDIEKSGDKHPLIDYAVINSKEKTYCFHTEFNLKKHWVLSEHKIFDRYIVPGTVFLEMVREGMYRITKKEGAIEFKNVVYLSSLYTKGDDSVEVQTLIQQDNDCYHFTIGSGYHDGGVHGKEWDSIYCEGQVITKVNSDELDLTLSEVKQKCTDKVESAGSNRKQNQIFLGERWTKLVREVYKNDNEVLVKIELPKEYENDLEEYYIHPSIYDMAINAVSQNVGNDVYLPFNYGSLKVFSKTEKTIYTFIHRNDQEDNSQMVSCDVVLFNEKGRIIAKVKDFIAKKVNRPKQKYDDSYSYKISYRECTNVQKDNDYIEKPVLIIGGKTKKTSGIIEKIKKTRKNVTEIYLSDKYEKVSSNKFYIDNTQESYSKVLSQCINDNMQIIHLLSLNDNNSNDIDSNLQNGVYSLLKIARSIIEMKIQYELDIVLVTDYMKKIGEQSRTNPYNGCMAGLGKVLTNEVSNVQCRVLDIDDLKVSSEIDSVVENINSHGTQLYTAYRNGKAYGEVIETAKLPSADNFQDMIQENGVYIITGGMGSLGIRIAKCISDSKKTNIALIGRKEIKQLNDINDSTTINNQLEENINILRSISESGTNITYYRGDVSDKSDMSGIFNELRNKFGKINGIVHGAGVIDDAFIMNKTDESFKKVLKPKVYGNNTLLDITRDDKLDFFINFSSISSLYGYPSQGDYAAANAYLDSSEPLEGTQVTKYITINWAPWKDAGMAYESNQKDTGVFKMLPTDIGIEAFKRVLLNDNRNIIIGKIDYEKLEIFYEKAGLQFDDEILNHMKNKGTNNLSVHNTAKDSNKPIEKNRYDNAPVEKELIKIWNDILGLEDIDIYKSFFNLGGDSIQAVALSKAVEQKYPGIVKVSDIFTYPSINEMTQYITSKLDIEVKDTDNRFTMITDVLYKLEKGELSVDEAERLIDKS